MLRSQSRMTSKEMKAQLEESMGLKRLLVVWLMQLQDLQRTKTKKRKMTRRMISYN